MKVTQNNDTDRRLRQLLRSDLPDVNENPWFTRRVVNRLPPQSAIARVSLVQWICYILIGAGHCGRMELSCHSRLF